MHASALRLADVVVTASPTGADPLRITQSTVELAGKELQRNLGGSVAQTLSSEPGMAMRFNGPAANVPVIRGLSGERILVLQDGQRAGDLSSTSSDHGLSVDPLTASRMEVVRGPASLLYGTQRARRRRQRHQQRHPHRDSHPPRRLPGHAGRVGHARRGGRGGA